MTFTSVQKLSITSGGALTIVGLIGLASYLNTRQMVGTQLSVSVTNANIGRLDRVLDRTRDADLAARRYVVTRDTADLAAIDEAQSDVEFALDSLRTATEDNPEQRHNLDRLAPLVAARLAEIRLRVAARQRFGTDSANGTLRAAAAGAAHDGESQLFLRMREAELRVLGQRTRFMTDTGRAATNFILGGTLLAFVLALVALQPLRPSVAHRLSASLAEASEPSGAP